MNGTKQAMHALLFDTECPGCSNDSWHMMGGSVWWIVIIVIVVVAAILVLRYIVHSSPPDYDEELDDAISILQKRYARGEISKEEYEIKLNDLSIEEH